MKTIKKSLTAVIIAFVVITASKGCKQVEAYRNIDGFNLLDTVKISVFLYNLEDDYISSVKKSLEEIQAKNHEEVQFTFYDSKGDQGIQNESIEKAINEGTDLLLVNLVDGGAAQQVINKIKESNLPVILFNREPVTPAPIQSYSKALYIGGDEKEAGILQGQILIEEWNDRKNIIDTNGDGIIQYIMLIGERDTKAAVERTKYSIDTIQKAGINTEELASRVASWSKELGKRATEALWFRYGSRIEAIISNDDAMAEGAIEALQELGYNKGDKNTTIPVVGVNATPDARELINKGFMTGTVIQDNDAMAEAIYSVGMNLLSGRNPLEGTNYVLDETLVAIRLPYSGYIKN